MTQGKLESIPLEVQKQMSSLEIRIMQDIVMRIKTNGFSSATADWEITRLQQLGQSEENIRKWIKEALSATDEEVDRIFSDEVYSEYYGHERAYQVMGFSQIPFEQNEILQQYIKAAAEQTKGTFQNLTASMGFAVRQPGTGHIQTKKLRTYYVETLDKAINDIHSGAFDYNTVLRRTIKELTDSGLRTIGYESTSGRTTSTRVDVAARRAIMTGFRQVQAKINEQTMDDLHTEYVEVSYHVGARPTHQVWQGKVYHWDRGEKKDSSGKDTKDAKEVKGLGAGDAGGEMGEHDPPVYLEKIDISDENMILSKLEEYEKLIVDSDIENAIVVTKSGEVIQCFGDKESVYPDTDLEGQLTDAYVTHNHPAGSSNEYSFSNADINLFVDTGMKVLHGVDEKYVYELTRNANQIDGHRLLQDITEYDSRHERVIEVAKSLGIGYRRWERGQG